MQRNLGCRPGTKARRPVIIPEVLEALGKLDRCPLAILRDMEPREEAWAMRIINLASAHRSGSLSAYINNMSARTEDLITSAAHTIGVVQAEAAREN
jgi:hypothetical protein